jgi:glycosyltransferase involved in cell wall biosynthesis
MPCHNAGETVDEAMASLLEQTWERIEIIAVDDGSSDDTGPRLEAWRAQDDRVRILEQEHQGIIAALNAGLAAAEGGFIARMDADDRCSPERIAKQIAYLLGHPELAVVGCQVAGFPDTLAEGFRIYIQWLNSLITHEDLTREIFIESPLVHPSVIMRRTWLERVGGYADRGWAEDYDLWLRFYLAGGRFAKLPEILFYWREDPQRLTRTDRRYSVENFLRAKAHYLRRGPLSDRDAVIVWGAGQMGRRLSKHLQREGAPLMAFVDIDPGKIGRERRGCPIVPPESLPGLLAQCQRPVVLAAVGSRGARELIRERLDGFGLKEGVDYWAVA